MEKCYICEKGKLVKKKEEFKLYGESLGKFDAEVCDRCGEVFFDENVSDEIDDAAKKTGLFGLEASTHVGKTGDSLMIRVNKQIADFLNLKKGKEVKLIPKNRHELLIGV